MNIYYVCVWMRTCVYIAAQLKKNLTIFLSIFLLMASHSNTILIHLHIQPL